MVLFFMHNIWGIFSGNWTSFTEPSKNSPLFILLDGSTVFSRKFKVRVSALLEMLYICLTLNISLYFFRLYLHWWWGWLVWKIFFSSRILNLVVLNTIYMLKNSQICVWEDCCPELRLVCLTAHLTSLADMSKTKLLSFPPKSVPAKASHLSWWRLQPSRLSVQKPWSHLDSSIVYTTTNVLANSLGSPFRIYP